MSIDTLATSNDEIGQNQDSRRVRKFSEIPSLLLLNVVYTIVSSKRLGLSRKFPYQLEEDM